MNIHDLPSDTLTAGQNAATVGLRCRFDAAPISRRLLNKKEARHPHGKRARRPGSKCGRSQDLAIHFINYEKY